MVNHPDSVTYDAFDCNSGKPHEPNTHWDPNTSAWEWDDLTLSSGSVPDSWGLGSNGTVNAVKQSI